MFVQAIERVSEFTRPIHSVIRYYKSNILQPGAATLIFVNSNGDALTCGHVVQNLLAEKALLKKSNEFKKEYEALKGTKKEKQILKELERKYDYHENTPVELKNRFCDCFVGNTLQLDFTISDKADLALIRFRTSANPRYRDHAVFPKDTSGLKQGKYLCRLGFPFAEFSNFRYDEEKDCIVWTEEGNPSSPRFPIDGMLTRFLMNGSGKRFGFEMSTPGLKGQSGGPVFDEQGRVWGMQFATNHLDLDFDIKQKVIRGGKSKEICSNTFLHVGHCNHVDIIKDFLRQQNVEFVEE